MNHLYFSKANGIKHFFTTPIDSTYASQLSLQDNTQLYYYPQVLYDYIKTKKITVDEVINILQNYNSSSVRLLMEILHNGETTLNINNLYKIKIEGDKLVELFKMIKMKKIAEATRLKILHLTHYVDYKICLETLEEQLNVKIFKDSNHTLDNLVDLRKEYKYNDLIEHLQKTNAILPNITHYLQNPNYNDAMNLFYGNIDNDNFKIFFDLLVTIQTTGYTSIKKHMLMTKDKTSDFFNGLLKSIESEKIVSEKSFTSYLNLSQQLTLNLNDIRNIIPNIFDVPIAFLEFIFGLCEVKKIITNYIEEKRYPFTCDELIVTLFDLLNYNNIKKNANYEKKSESVSKMIRYICNFDQIIISIISAYTTDRFSFDNIEIIYEVITGFLYYNKKATDEEICELFVMLHKQYPFTLARSWRQIILKIIERIENSGSYTKAAIKK